MSHDAILALSDFSGPARQAVQRAALLAVDLARPLHILHVQEKLQLDSLQAVLGDNAANIQHMIREEAKNAMKRQVDELMLGLGLKAQPHLLEGRVLSTILAKAQAVAAGLIVVGVRGQSRLRPLLLGSTTERVLRKSRLPVLTVKQQARSAYERVLVPVDFSKDSAAALKLAQELAPQAEITVLHVYSLPFEGRVLGDWSSGDEVASYQRQFRDHARQELELFLRRTVGEEHGISSALINGQAYQAILAAEQELAADLIVMGSHGQGYLEQVLLGSVARHVLTHSNCDVLISPHPV